MRSVPESDIPEIPFLWTHGIAARETLRYLGQAPDRGRAAIGEG